MTGFAPPDNPPPPAWNRAQRRRAAHQQRIIARAVKRAKPPKPKSLEALLDLKGAPELVLVPPPAAPSPTSSEPEPVDDVLAAMAAEIGRKKP